jgi:hypothetical protein
VGVSLDYGKKGRNLLIFIVFWFHMNFEWTLKADVQIDHRADADCSDGCDCVRASDKTWRPVHVGLWNWKQTVGFLANMINILVGAAIVSLHYLGSCRVSLLTVHQVCHRAVCQQ